MTVQLHNASRIDVKPQQSGHKCDSSIHACDHAQLLILRPQSYLTHAAAMMDIDFKLQSYLTHAAAMMDLYFRWQGNRCEATAAVKER